MATRELTCIVCPRGCQLSVELDGNAVGESVTTYQERENLHSNGY